MSCGSVDAKWKEVPRMLNAISGLETAAESHAAFATGAVLPSGVRIAQSPCTGAVLARPRAFWAAAVFGRSRMADDLNVALGQRNCGMQNHKATRLAEQSGGDQVNHKLRDTHR